MGRRLIQSNRTHLLVSGGIAWNIENYADTAAAHSAEAAGGVEWHWFEIGGATEAAVEATTFVSLARERVRLELDASLRREFFWDLYWSANVFESFDGSPPDDRPRSDLGLSLTIGYTF